MGTLSRRDGEPELWIHIWMFYDLLWKRFFSNSRLVSPRGGLIPVPQTVHGSGMLMLDEVIDLHVWIITQKVVDEAVDDDGSGGRISFKKTAAKHLCKRICYSRCEAAPSKAQ